MIVISNRLLRELILIVTVTLMALTTSGEQINGYWTFTETSIEKIVSNYIEELKEEIENPDTFRSNLESSFENQYRKFEVTGENKVTVSIIHAEINETTDTRNPYITQHEFLYKGLGSSKFEISNDQSLLMHGILSKDLMDYTDIETGLQIQMRKISQEELESNLSEIQLLLLNYSMTDEFDYIQLSDLDEFFVPAKLDKDPKIKKSVSPRYPPELKKERITGEVVLVFIVDEEGKPRNIEIGSSTDDRFNQAAIDALAATHFEPGEKDGKTVKTQLRLPITFTLKR